MSIELISFDLDNTLWESHQVLLRATEKTNAWISENVPQFRTLSSDGQESIRKSIFRQQPEIVHDVSEFRLAYMARCFEAVGIDSATAKRLASDAFDVFMHWRCQVEPYPAAVSLLAELSASYKLVSITNGNSDVSRTSIDRFFEFHVSAASAGAAKPDTRIFLHTLARANIVDPANAIHIGDSFEDDVEGASAAGMKTIWLDHAGSPTQQVATATVQNLTEIVPAVRLIAESLD